jgi:hypothetical protein
MSTESTATASSSQPGVAAQAATELQTIQLVVESKLTEEQQKILTFVYDSAKGIAADVLNSSNGDAMKVTRLMGSIVKLMESLTFNNVKIAGASKKAVGLQLGRNLINDLVKDEALKSNMLAVYDLAAESTLELLIDVSRNVNVKAVTEAATSCCGWLADLLGRKQPPSS